jgi:hypothetical protein
MVSVAMDVAAVAQGAIGSAVRVNVTEPAVTSAGLGAYVVLSCEASAKVPVPLVVHVTDAWLLAVPDTAAAARLQVPYGPPALTVGAGCTATATDAQALAPQTVVQRAK